jgi:Zn-dependent M32 family carboxypeptidase
MLTPRDRTATPSTHLATTFESSLEAQSLDAARNESFPSDPASQSGQTPVTAKERTAHAQVSKQEEHPHASTATSVVKAQSLWRTAFDSNKLDDPERETLKVIDFQANAAESVSKARSSAENLLQAKKEKSPKIQKLLNCMDRFKEIGDIVVQFDPVHAALPWAGVRLLLKVDYTARPLDWTC